MAGTHGGRLAVLLACALLILRPSPVCCGRPSAQLQDAKLQSEDPVQRRELLVNPWIGRVASIGAAGLRLCNDALTAVASGDGAQTGASVFGYVDFVLKGGGQENGAGSDVDLAELLNDLTVKMEQIVYVVPDILQQALPESLSAKFNAMHAAQTYMVNSYLPLKRYNPRDSSKKPKAETLTQLLVDGDVENIFRSAAAEVLAHGPAGIPAALIAMAQHLAVLQERFYLGETSYRYVIRKYAAQYYHELSINGDLITEYLAQFFNTARQNYPSTTFTLELDDGSGPIYYINSDEHTAIRVAVSRTQLQKLLGVDRWSLCAEATSESATCGLVTDADDYKYLTYMLSFMGSFGPAINSLDTLRGFGNLDEAASECVGCTISLPAALNGSLARGKPANQSSTATGGRPSLAVDGNDGYPDGIATAGTCAQTSTNGTTDPWWRVDLGESQTVTSVHLFNRRDCCQEQINGVEVWVGQGQDRWASGGNTKCSYVAYPYWANAALSSDFPFSIVCSGVSGRYVWVHLPGPNRVLTLCEVVVLGAVAVPAYSGSSDSKPASTCLNTASPNGQCGRDRNLCCPSITPCCGMGGVCANTTTSCGIGCQAPYSFNGLCGPT